MKTDWNEKADRLLDDYLAAPVDWEYGPNDEDSTEYTYLKLSSYDDTVKVYIRLTDDRRFYNRVKLAIATILEQGKTKRKNK